MPVKYVGVKSNLVGKILFEILGNLKNFGVGRVVVRGSLKKRYPEPTYYKIVKVDPLMDEENNYGDVWVEKVFRGIKHDKIEILPAVYKKDYQLLSKEEEMEYCKPLSPQPLKRIMPAYGTFPPLFKELILRDRKQRGESTQEEPKLPLVYCDNPDLPYRVAAPGETPTVETAKRRNISLYQDVRKSD